jgi:hypothetical protein
MLMIGTADVPKEIMDYLEQNRRFCEWYVEVAWQRLPEKEQTEQLKKHWCRFGDLENPKHSCRPIPDKTDDWLIREHIVTFRQFRDNFKTIRSSGGLRTWVKSSWRRLGLINEIW